MAGKETQIEQFEKTADTFKKEKREWTEWKDGRGIFQYC